MLSGIVFVLTQNWRRLACVILPFSIAFGAVLVVENVAIAKIDRWLPVESFQTAARYSVYVSAAALWLRLCVVGVGVSFAFKALHRNGGAGPAAGFPRFWFIVCLGLALSLMAIDLWAYSIQFGDASTSETTARWSWLATLYARIAVYYLAVRLLLGASCARRVGTNRAAAAWNATTTLQSFGWFLALLVLKLVVDGVIVDLVSFAPVVSPFWFVSDEISPVRYFFGHGIKIFAESCGVFLYVAFWIAADHRICAREPAGSPGRDQTGEAA
jgi:hypothetical protein